MRGKIKMILGMALVLGAVSIALLATPIQAYVNGTSDGDLLQAQDRDRLRTKDCKCDGDMLQTRDHIRDRLRTQDCECNCTPSLEQYRCQDRNQNREGTNLAP